jgi:serine protease
VKTRALAVLITLFLASAAFAGEKGKIEKSNNRIPGQYIVVFEKGVENAGAVADELAARHGGQRQHVYSRALKGFSVRLPERRALQLAADPRVAWIEEDAEVTLDATQSNATWGLDRIDQRNLPLSGTYTYNTTASNVTVYVIDTGIRASHNEFGGRVRSGYTAINDGRGSGDCNGHGTHVAGTVGGSTWGVAKGVKLVAVRVLDCNGSGTTAGVIAGIDWVTQDHAAGAPAVANMSLGGGASSSIDAAVNNSISDGVTYVVASGNDNRDACNYSPARVAAAITVNASTSSDARASFSNWGTCTDIFAPGQSITSAWHSSNSATNTISGTSMAAPHVAGVAALYLSGNTSASPSTVWSAIRDSATPNKISSAGSGSPNRLLYSLFGGGSQPPPDDTVTLSNGQIVSSLSGSSGSWKHFKIAVPSGQSKLEIVMSGGSGDADLYVKRGSKPTLSSYDYRPYLNGNNETVTVNNPASGDWYISMHGYSSYSGVSLKATYTAPSACTTYTGTLSGRGDSKFEPNGSYYYSGSSGAHTGQLTGPSGTDFDLFLQKWNGSSWSVVARSEGSTSTESISYNGTAGYYRWRIYSYSGSGTYNLCATRP